jgi:sugar O-acyltransferase (sialic acid O-acetyltransferase NeuD family)
MSLIIVGAGGFGREIYQYALDTQCDIKGFLDDDSSSLDGFDIARPILGSINDFQPAATDQLILAIGDPAIKQKLAQQLALRGAQFSSMVHPLAYVAPTAQIGMGCIIAPFAFVGPYAVIGDHVSINTYASAGHDSRIGEFSSLSPYSVVNGQVEIGRAVLLGTHAVVVLGKYVGQWAKLAAGAIALQDVPEYALAVGNPAKSRVMFAPESPQGPTESEL